MRAFSILFTMTLALGFFSPAFAFNDAWVNGETKAAKAHFINMIEAYSSLDPKKTLHWLNSLGDKTELCETDIDHLERQLGHTLTLMEDSHIRALFTQMQIRIQKAQIQN